MKKTINPYSLERKIKRNVIIEKRLTKAFKALQLDKEDYVRQIEYIESTNAELLKQAEDSSHTYRTFKDYYTKKTYGGEYETIIDEYSVLKPTFLNDFERNLEPLFKNASFTNIKESDKFKIAKLCRLYDIETPNFNNLIGLEITIQTLKFYIKNNIEYAFDKNIYEICPKCGYLKLIDLDCDCTGELPNYKNTKDKKYYQINQGE